MSTSSTATPRPPWSPPASEPPVGDRIHGRNPPSSLGFFGALRKCWPGLALGLTLAACNGTATHAPTDRGSADDRSNQMTASGSRPGPPIKTRAPAPRADAAARPRSEKVFPETIDGAAALPAVTTGADLDRHDGAQVRLIGVYVERDARMRAEPPPVFVGHASLQLADGTAVSLLPVWHRDALRPEAEIGRYRDQQVEVVGLVFRKAPPDPKGGASPTGPTLLDVKALRALP